MAMRAVWSRRVGYPVLGAVLACLCSFGLLVAQAIAYHRALTLNFLSEQVASLRLVYAYTSCCMLCVLTFLGWLWGRREALLQAGSLTDPLTGLWNRRQLGNRMQEELARAVRHRAPLAFLLVDLDCFKQLNDRHGHYAGDEALRDVAEAIRRSCRRSDVPARYGGDEFAVLAPATAGGDAVALGERIRVAVHETSADYALSVSIGVADLSDLSAPSIERPHELCLAADRALYLAKERGRDQVACARDLDGSPLLEEVAT